MTRRPSFFPLRCLVRLLLATTTGGVLLAGAGGIPGPLPAARAQQVGAIDPSFVDPNQDLAAKSADIVAGANFTVFAVGLQPQPDRTVKVIVAGDNATCFRFNQDGTFDGSFNASPSISFGLGSSAARTIYALVVQPEDNRVLVGGNFFPPDRSNKLPAINVGRLNNDGSTDELTGFNANVGSGADGSVLTILRRGAGQPILLGGQFTHFNGQGLNRLVQVNDDGTFDPAFNANLGSGADAGVFVLAAAIDPNTGQPNGQVYVGGKFSKFNGHSGDLVRLNADGSVDGTFNVVVANPADGVFALSVQTDGRLVIGGGFTTVNGQSQLRLARLNFDGTLDGTFNAPITESNPAGLPPTAVYSLLRQADGKLYVGGNFLRASGAARYYVARLNADGSNDPGFDSGSELPNAVQSIVLAPVALPNNAGFVFDPVIGQTRADKRIVPGDAGYFFSPVVRLVGDYQVLNPPVPRLLGITTTQPARQVQPNGHRARRGVFTVSRVSGDATQALTVHFALLKRTTAQRNVDFTLRANGQALAADATTFALPAGVSSAQLVVVPTDTPLFTGTRRVAVRILPDPAGLYQLGQPNSSSLLIKGGQP